MKKWNEVTATTKWTKSKEWDNLELMSTPQPPTSPTSSRVLIVGGSPTKQPTDPFLKARIPNKTTPGQRLAMPSRDCMLHDCCMG